MSGAVLWVVAGDLNQPTSAGATPVVTPAEDEARPAPVVPVSRRPATPPAARPQTTTAAFGGAPLARHRVRSGVLLVLLSVTIGVAVAAVIAAVVVALAFAVRNAVTS